MKTRVLVSMFVAVGIWSASPSPAQQTDTADFRRDYKLEAIDDSAGFSFTRDLKGFFLSQFLIERDWEDKVKRQEWFRKYMIRNEAHWYQVLATSDRYLQSPKALQKYGSQGDIIQLKMDATTEYFRSGLQNNVHGASAALLTPVEGISLEQWARCQARLARQEPLADILKELTITEAKWNEATKIWNERMAKDSTYTIVNEYGKYFLQSDQGAYSSAAQDAAQAMTPGGRLTGAAPFSLEKFVEILQHQAVAYEHGIAAADILKKYDMTVVDWSQGSAYWSEKMTAESMKNDAAQLLEFNRLSEIYRKKFAEQYGGNK